MDQPNPPPNPHPEDPYWAARILQRRRKRLRAFPYWWTGGGLVLFFAAAMVQYTLQYLNLPHPPDWVIILILCFWGLSSLKLALTIELGRAVPWRDYFLFILTLSLAFLLRLTLLGNKHLAQWSLPLFALNVVALVLVKTLWPVNETKEPQNSLHCPACLVALPPGELSCCLHCRVPLRLPEDEGDGKSDEHYAKVYSIFRRLFWIFLVATLVIFPSGFLIDHFFSSEPWVDTAWNVWGWCFAPALLGSMAFAALSRSCPCCESGGRLRSIRVGDRKQVKCMRCGFVVKD